MLSWPLEMVSAAERKEWSGHTFLELVVVVLFFYVCFLYFF